MAEFRVFKHINAKLFGLADYKQKILGNKLCIFVIFVSMSFLNS